ncbi:hypothetical protein HYH03_002824 [Edaphochlamys debaryana]|uniref:Uncharacterized protein n=1 Tax=Edaphochlamys debaryana TaxID=47281 RepID=A0A835YA95_9CHLO|nr:hypothetical protein HYH03_002824 [Edaphochlamys debaryana]|eukprot:KAG2499245.1 hypothetical protein HYH03_002824 [Edaphochlamys debaryana]
MKLTSSNPGFSTTASAVPSSAGRSSGPDATQQGSGRGVIAAAGLERPLTTTTPPASPPRLASTEPTAVASPPAGPEGRGEPQSAGSANVGTGTACTPDAATQAAVASSIQAADKMGVAGDKPAASSFVPVVNDPLPNYQPPGPLAPAYMPLGALPGDTPVPLNVLCVLWGCEASKDRALQIARALAAAGILRLAALEDGSHWALVDPPHMAHAAAVAPNDVLAAHQRLLAAYQAQLAEQQAAAAGGQAQGGRQGGSYSSPSSGVFGGAPPLTLSAVRDDGYIVQALSHHLVGTGRATELRELLSDPAWLEAKLHAYGAGAVVRDFRRYLTWAEAAEGRDPGVAPHTGDVRLLLQALQLSLSAVTQNPTARVLREQMLARLLIVAAGGRLQMWFENQFEACMVESAAAAAAGQIVVLMPRSPSLEQAGGVHRMTLRSHTAPVRQVALAPVVCHIATASDDGTAQVWDMNTGDCLMELTGRTPLTCVAVTADATAAVLGGADGTAVVWGLAAAGPAAAGKVLQTLTGHMAKVNAVAVDRQGLRVVTASDDRTARVWSLKTGVCEAVLRGHGGMGMVGHVLGVSVSSDGTLAATCSDDFTARVWDLDEDWGLEQDEAAASGWTFEPKSKAAKAKAPPPAPAAAAQAVLEGHSGWVVSVAFLGSTHTLISASHDATARVWDADRGRCLRVLSGHEGRINRVVVDVGGTWALTCSDDNTARLWDVDSGECKHVLEGHGGHMVDGAISRDGRRAITTSGGGSCALWDTASGRRVALLEGHSGEVPSVAFSQRARFAVTAGTDCTVRVWDLTAAAEQAGETDDGAGVSIGGSSGAEGESAVAAAVAAARKTVMRAVPPPTHSGRVASVQALQPRPGAGPLVMSAGDDGKIILWDAAEGTCLKAVEGHRVAVRFMRVSADGETAVTGSGDRQICRWNWSDFSIASALVGPGATASPQLDRRDLVLGSLATSGGYASTAGLRRRVTAGGGGSLLNTLNSNQGEGCDGEDDPLAELAAMKRGGHAPGTNFPSGDRGIGTTRGVRAPVGGGTQSQQGGLDGSGTGDRTSPGITSPGLLSPGAGSPGPSPGLPGRVAGLNLAVARSTGGSSSGLPAAFHAASGTADSGGIPGTNSRSLLDVVSSLHTDPLHSTLPAQQGSRVKAMSFDAACTSAAVVLFDSTVAVWDLATGRVASQLIKRGERDASRTHASAVNSVLLSADGGTAVTISKDCTARVWDVAKGTTRYVVSGHKDALVAADISGDESLLATASYDGAVRITRMINGSAVAVLEHHSVPIMLSFSPAGSQLAVALEDHTVVLWDLVNRCCMPHLTAHTAALAALSWSRDGRFLLTGSADCTLRIWRAEDGAQHGLFVADSPITTACFAGAPIPDCVVAGDSTGCVHFLDFTSEMQG